MRSGTETSGAPLTKDLPRLLDGSCQTTFAAGLHWWLTLLDAYLPYPRQSTFESKAGFDMPLVFSKALDPEGSTVAAEDAVAGSFGQAASAGRELLGLLLSFLFQCHLYNLA